MRLAAQVGREILGLSDDRVLVLVDGDGGVVVKPLRLEHLGQVALVARRLLQLGPLVLEPDLDLRLVQPQLVGQVLPPVLVEVAVVLKLLPEPGELLRAEGGPGPLLLGRGSAGGAVGGAVLLLDLSRSRS